MKVSEDVPTESPMSVSAMGLFFYTHIVIAIGIYTQKYI